MAFKKTSKSKLYIGTNTTALASESSWTEIEGVKNIGGSAGSEWVTADGTVFSDDYQQNYKVIKKGGDMEITLQRDLDLPGQNALQTAFLSKLQAPYNFKVAFDDDAAGGTDEPSTILFPARVLSFGATPGGVTSSLEAKAKLDITGATIETAAA